MQNTHKNCLLAREPRRNQKAYEAGSPQSQRNYKNDQSVTVGTDEKRKPCTHNSLPGRRTVAEPLSPSVELSETAKH